MRFVLVILALLGQSAKFSKCQSIGGDGVDSAGTGPPALQRCRFPQSKGAKPIHVPYNQSLFSCVRCKTSVTLVSKPALKARKHANVCQQKCHGLLCSDGCRRAVDIVIGGGGTLSCVTSRAGIPKTDGEEEDNTISNGSRIPLIIGFTVGGILLVIVIAGIFLGRHQRVDDRDGSEVVTTPVSLSNSEWHSNAGSGSSRRKEENLRVQEASTEDLTALPLYVIHGYKNAHAKDENGNEYLMKCKNDGSSLGGDSFRSCDIPSQNATVFNYNTVSNRSSDVVLDDGYVTGGNFIGSGDFKAQKLLIQSSVECEEQNFFDGNTPGSMTHDAICMSLTHSSNQAGGIEYVIEDSDLIPYDAPSSYSKITNTPPINGGMRLSEADEEGDTMQISLQFDDGDSDFEDENISGERTQLTDVFSPSSMYTSEGSDEEHQFHEPYDAVYRDKKYHPASIPTSVSWNDNCKGRSREKILHNEYQYRNGVSSKATSRSMSCNWKSPHASNHSSTRKHSVPNHCPSSVPTYSRPRPNNLTHVFVDVHRNMASSDEDLLSYDRASPGIDRIPSISDSDSDSFKEIPISTLQSTPDHRSYDVQYPPPVDPATKLAAKQRNKSMYVLRNGEKRTQPWTPRTVRFSSSDSGEYAIPFGSLVP